MSSPSASVGPAPPAVRKGHYGRHNLRNGTFILPGTGERIRRQITLRRSSPPEDEAYDGPSDPNPIQTLQRRFSRSLQLQPTIDTTRAKALDLWEWFKTPTGRGVLKCSISYVLGGMGTFFPPLSKFLGHQDGKHIMATVTVYFHPARSAGSMVEALICALAAYVYAALISVGSMATAVLFETQFDLIELAYVLILVIFCAGGLGFVGWVKQRLSNPLVNTACSLTSLAIITVITKENAVQTGVFSNDKILQVMKMVLIGVFFTTAVNLLVWPTSARAELRESMIKTTDNFGEMLRLITRSFLSGNEDDMRSAAFNSSLKRHNTVFKILPKHLREAKFEHYVVGTEEEYRLEKELVSCMQRLSHAIGGLRSAATTQFLLLKDIKGTGYNTPSHSRSRTQPESGLFSPPNGPSDPLAPLSVIDEASDECSDDDGRFNTLRGMLRRQDSEVSYGEMTNAQTSADIFNRFVEQLGPSMKSLAFTLCQILEELPFGQGPDYRIVINSHFSPSLSEALEVYTNARSRALRHIYRSKELGKDRSEKVEANLEEVAASCGQFSYNLQDFAREMQVYLDILEQLKFEVESPRRRTWKWLLFWRHDDRWILRKDPEERLLPPSPDDAIGREDPVVSSTMRSKTPLKRDTKVILRLWEFKRLLRREDIRFALKVGIGAALWAMIAFIPATRPFYQHWRGEWGLLSYMLVCSMTIGASNTTGWSRFFGTFIGALMSLTAWFISQGNAFVLIFVGWIFCMPCFYLIVGCGKGPMGRFILLTYNLSVLYAYSLSVKDDEDDDDEGGSTPHMTEIALHRVMAVMFGCLWGLIVTRMIWPISARKKLKDGLALLWLRMALIWRRDPLSALLEGNFSASHSYMNLGEETALRQYLSRLEGLRTSAMSEVELRGPFPAEEYGRILQSTGEILDAFHAMNVVIQKDPKASEGEAAILEFTAEERAQLSSRISHLFQVLASSMKLEYPLNDELPDTANSRNRLLAKIYQYRKLRIVPTIPSTPNVNAHGSSIDRVFDLDSPGMHARSSSPVRSAAESVNEGTMVKDEDFALLYAYALVTGQVDREIKKVEGEIESLFGVLTEDVLRLT